MSEHSKGVWMTVAAALVWSTGGLLIKWIEQDAFTILFYRSFYAGILFLFVFRRAALRLDKKTILISLCYAPLLICFVSATKMTTAANAIFLQYIAPAIVLIAEPRIFKIPLKRYNVITVIVCTLGMSLFLFEQKEGSHWIGDGIALLSGMFAAALFLTLKMSNRTQQMSGITLGNMWIVLITLPWFLKSPPASLEEHGMLAFLGFVQIGLGYLLFTYGQRRIPATESALIAMLEPILNPLWVMIGYQEIPSSWSLAGGFIILTALAARMIYVARYDKKPLIT